MSSSVLRASVSAVFSRLSKRQGKWCSYAPRPKRAFPACTELRIGIADAMTARPFFPNVEEVEVVVGAWSELLESEAAVREAYRPARVKFVLEAKKAGGE